MEYMIRKMMADIEDLKKKVDAQAKEIEDLKKAKAK